MNEAHNNAVGPQARSIKKKTIKVTSIAAFLGLLFGLSIATQFFAQSFQYQPALGGHIYNIYLPWSILIWAFKWYSIYPSLFMKAGGLGITFSSIILIGIVMRQMMTSSASKSNQYLHGSARWANMNDIQSANLLPRSLSLWEKLMGKNPPRGDGVYVGAWLDKDGKQHYLRHNGPEHVLCYAPTRSGKGVGLVIPTLLSWEHSAVITDLKGELWALTAGWRQKYAKNKVLRFEPATLDGSVRWNPLDEIRIGTEYEVGDVQNLATLIVDPDGKGLETHWQKTSQALLVALILHILYKKKTESTPATLHAVDALLSDPSRSIGDLWLEMTQYGHIDGKNHPVVGAEGRKMIDRPEEEAGSVKSTAESYLSLYKDPVVANNVSCSDFSIKDLMHHQNPVSLYIVTQPNDKARLRPLVRIMLNMIVRLLADKMEFEKGRTKINYKHRLLMMMDEFPSLGKLEIMQESLAFIAGYGIKCYLICQDLNQLKSKESGYGPDETITSNCHIQNAYPPNRVETAEHLSKLTGQTTIIKEQITTSGRRLNTLFGQFSRTLQEVQRPLLTVDECLRMQGPIKRSDGQDGIEKPGHMIIYAAGFPAIYGQQPLYFKDPVFQARAEVPTSKKSDRLTYASENEEIKL
ncbi:MAG: type IV secretory system conjugative DNA transfer family protein [Gammaproteobacteria bacterium]